MARLFISHRSADTREAERLANDLRARGHRVRIDAAEIGLGDSIVQWMNDALGDARFVVLCLSSSGVDAPWMSREWLSTLARQLNGDGVKLLPVRLTGGQPPALLADVKYADAVADWTGAVAAIDAATQNA